MYREILSVLLCLSAAFVSVLDDVMPESIPQGYEEAQQQRVVSSYCLGLFLSFYFLISLFRGVEMSQSGVSA